jgi:hypothetical protein
MPETPARERYIQAAIVGACAGIAMAVFMIFFVYTTGATFGQRCEAKGLAKWSDEWDRCIEKFQRGE